jgi:hypothetical protein
MITLNLDKELTKIANWEDVLARPGFTKDLDSTTVKLGKIIGHYQLIDRVPCGLRDCRQPHNRGYLVALTDGCETNIGNDCGETYFDVEFKSLRRQYDRDVRNKERREAISTCQVRIPHYREQIRGIRGGDTGADWIYEHCQALVVPGHGLAEAVRREIAKAVRARNGRLERQRQATEKEVDQLRAAGARGIRSPHYISEPVGTLEGIAALYPENDLRDLLTKGAIAHLNGIEPLVVDNLSAKDLGHHAKVASEIEKLLRRAEDAVVEGRKLLRRKNLGLLTEYIDDRRARVEFQSYLQKLPV